MLALSLVLSLSAGQIAQAPRSAALLSPEERMTLQARYDELKLTPNPSLGGPIALLVTAVVGVGVAIGTLYVSLLLGAFAGASGVLPLLIFAAVVGIIGVGLGITGGVLLASVLRERRARSVELKELQKQLQSSPIEQPLPPMPPPSVQGPTPSLMLAAF